MKRLDKSTSQPQYEVSRPGPIMSPHQSQHTRLPLGAVAPQRLTDARLQCHHAAQVIVALGVSLLPRREDDGHTTLGWEPGLGALVSHPVPGTDQFQGGLVLTDLELVNLGSGAPSRFGLDGQTQADAWQWLLGEVRRAGGDVKRMTNAKHYTIRVLIEVYRGDPTAAAVCERMVDLDEGLQEWRYRHVKMVERTIGTKLGTGGSQGAAYLKTTLDHPLFPDLWAIRADL